MVNLLYSRSSKTKCLVALFMMCMSKHHAQNGISFYAGAGGNTVLSNYANAVELDNKGKGKVSTCFNFDTKLKFSRHFSVSLNYLWTKNHIKVEFDNVQVTYFDHYSQTGGTVGTLTYQDDLYLKGSYIGASLNYEVRFSKSNLIFSLGLNRAMFGSANNKIDRYYESVPANSSYSNVEQRQTSSLTGANFMAASAAARYSRMIYKDKIGIFAQAIFMYNFINYSSEFTHSSLGWEDRYKYTYGNGITEVNGYYTLSYHSANCTLGIFYNINFRKNEDR